MFQLFPTSTSAGTRPFHALSGGRDWSECLHPRLGFLEISGIAQLSEKSRLVPCVSSCTEWWCLFPSVTPSFEPPRHPVGKAFARNRDPQSRLLGRFYASFLSLALFSQLGSQHTSAIRKEFDLIYNSSSTQEETHPSSYNYSSRKEKQKRKSTTP